MSEESALARITSVLDALSDDQMRQARREIDDRLARRANARRQQALSEIHRLAAAHGLNVAVKKRPRKRGRPPKEDGPAAL